MLRGAQPAGYLSIQTSRRSFSSPSFRPYFGRRKGEEEGVWVDRKSLANYFFLFLESGFERKRYNHRRYLRSLREWILFFAENRQTDAREILFSGRIQGGAGDLSLVPYAFSF